MKVLHTISQFQMGGAQTLLLDISKALRDKGVEINIVCFSEENHLKEKTDRIPYFKTIPSSMQLSMHRKHNYNFENAKKFIHDFNPDIIHSHLFEAELITRSIRFKKAKYFSHCHDNMGSFRKASVHTFLNKSLLTKYYERNYLLKLYRETGGNSFITISKDTYNYFRDNLPSDFDEIVLLYNAIDYGRFNANAKKKNEEQKLKLITVGSLVDNKNQIFLIKVVKYLKEQGLNVQLDILGEGPNRNLLSKRIEEEGLEAAVHLHGNVNEVEEYLWESQIYVHAAKSEAFGLVLVEAMSAGLPVVTLDGNGNRDLIEEGKNGYMVFEADIVAFSEKIILLHQNKFLYKDISKYATQYAKQYDINTYVNQLISLYDKALLKR